jgi:hypothetical protein
MSRHPNQLVQQFYFAVTFLIITFCLHLPVIAGGSDQPYQEGLFPDLPTDLELNSELKMPDEEQEKIRKPLARNQKKQPTSTTPGLVDFQSWQKTQLDTNVTCYDNNFHLICLTPEQFQSINH